jgi:hypothetical protein
MAKYFIDHIQQNNDQQSDKEKVYVSSGTGPEQEDEEVEFIYIYNYKIKLKTILYFFRLIINIWSIVMVIVLI